MITAAAAAAAAHSFLRTIMGQQVNKNDVIVLPNCFDNVCQKYQQGG